MENKKSPKIFGRDVLNLVQHTTSLCSFHPSSLLQAQTAQEAVFSQNAGRTHREQFSDTLNIYKSQTI